MGKVYVTNKALHIKRAPSSYALFCSHVATKGCDRVPRNRLKGKRIVKGECLERWRAMGEAERRVLGGSFSKWQQQDVLKLSIREMFSRSTPGRMMTVFPQAMLGTPPQWRQYDPVRLVFNMTVMAQRKT